MLTEKHANILNSLRQTTLDATFFRSECGQDCENCIFNVPTTTANYCRLQFIELCVEDIIDRLSEEDLNKYNNYIKTNKGNNNA